MIVIVDLNTEPWSDPFPLNKGNCSPFTLQEVNFLHSLTCIDVRMPQSDVLFYNTEQTVETSPGKVDMELDMPFWCSFRI